MASQRLHVPRSDVAEHAAASVGLPQRVGPDGTGPLRQHRLVHLATVDTHGASVWPVVAVDALVVRVVFVPGAAVVACIAVIVRAVSRRSTRIDSTGPTVAEKNTELAKNKSDWTAAQAKSTSNTKWVRRNVLKYFQ